MQKREKNLSGSTEQEGYLKSIFNIALEFIWYVTALTNTLPPGIPGVIFPPIVSESEEKDNHF